MSAMHLDRRVVRQLHLCGGIVALMVVASAAYALGTWTADRPWPYDVRSRRLVTEEVRPGGFLTMQRVIDYHDDCDLRYERRVQSSLPAGFRFVPQEVSFDHPPWDRSGKPQQSSVQIPQNFPCGPAYLVETISVGCTWYERAIQRRRKADIITPFFVVGCGAGE